MPRAPVGDPWLTWPLLQEPPELGENALVVVKPLLGHVGSRHPLRNMSPPWRGGSYAYRRAPRPSLPIGNTRVPRATGSSRG